MTGFMRSQDVVASHRIRQKGGVQDKVMTENVYINLNTYINILIFPNLPSDLSMCMSLMDSLLLLIFMLAAV